MSNYIIFYFSVGNGSERRQEEPQVEEEEVVNEII